MCKHEDFITIDLFFLPRNDFPKSAVRCVHMMLAYSLFDMSCNFSFLYNCNFLAGAVRFLFTFI